MCRGCRTDCRSRSKHLGEAQRLDAKAEGVNVAIGGWRRKEGRPTRESGWSRSSSAGATHLRLSREARRSALLPPSSCSGQWSSGMTPLPVAEVRTATVGFATLSCGTDYQGNSFLLDMPRSTIHPLGVGLMVLACRLGLRRACLHARRIPRLQSEGADAWTNGEFAHFSHRSASPSTWTSLSSG